MPQPRPITDVSQHVLDQIDAPWGSMRNAVEVSHALSNGNVHLRRQALHSVQAVTTPAPHRVRMAYWLSQILVISDRQPDINTAPKMVDRYWDVLMASAFGPYGDILKNDVYLLCQMFYLTFNGSQKRQPDLGISPDENYGREVMQLFTCGLNELDDDGKPTGGTVYGQADVRELSRVYTGWVVPLFDKNGNLDEVRNNHADNQRRNAIQMRNERASEYGPYLVHEHHDWGEISVLGLAIPSDENEYRSLLDAGDQEGIQALGRSRLYRSVDLLMAHPNTARTLSRQMIGMHVSRDYDPAYFRSVLQAARTGRYTLPDGREVGSGQVCDLAAMHAAALLHADALRDPDENGPRWGRHRPAWLAHVSALRPLVADSAIKPIDGTALMMGIFKNGVRSTWVEDCGTVPLTAPSVFSFFDLIAEVGAEGLDGVLQSELQEVDEGIVVTYPEHLVQTAFHVTARGIVNNRWGDQEQAPEIAFDLARFLSIAGDPPALAARLDLELCASRMTPEAVTDLEGLIASVPASSPVTEQERFRRFLVGWLAAAGDVSQQVDR